MRADHFGTYRPLVKTSKSRAAKLVFAVASDHREDPHLSHSQFVQELWTRSLVEAKRQSQAGSITRSLLGNIFENVLTATLIRAQVQPFYTQAMVQHVPNVNFDFLIWTEEVGPVAIAAKTSLRERYKQADLEAMALSSVHRQAQSYLVTLDHREASLVKSKVDSGAVMSLTDVVVANTPRFDDLVTKILSYSRISAPVLPTVTSGKFIAAHPPS